MMQLHLLETALLLGLYVLLAGGYALTYTLARMWHRPGFRTAAIAFYALHVLVVAGVVFWAPLWLGWKLLLVASSLAILAIPSVTLRYLERTHETGSISA
jgi:branched-subunit amino acid ABC-type transport system permease component